MEISTKTSSVKDRLVNKTTLERLIDYFEPGELADFLGVSVEDVALAFEDEVDLKIAQLNDLMGVDND